MTREEICIAMENGENRESISRRSGYNKDYLYVLYNLHRGKSRRVLKSIKFKRESVNRASLSLMNRFNAEWEPIDDNEDIGVIVIGEQKG